MLRLFWRFMLGLSLPWFDVFYCRSFTFVMTLTSLGWSVYTVYVYVDELTYYYFWGESFLYSFDGDTFTNFVAEENISLVFSSLDYKIVHALGDYYWFLNKSWSINGFSYFKAWFTADMSAISFSSFYSFIAIYLLNSVLLRNRSYIMFLLLVMRLTF